MKSKSTCLIALALCSLTNLAQADSIIDLRDEKWKTTTVKNTSLGPIQQLGDDTSIGNFANLIASRLVISTATKSDVIEIKTVDVRLSLSSGRVDENALAAAKRSSPKADVIAAPIAALFSGFAKDKTASAVFCVAINGKNYLGNDARLFRVGAEGELKDSIEAALSKLVQSVQSGNESSSVACEPGWEGGQPRP